MQEQRDTLIIKCAEDFQHACQLPVRLPEIVRKPGIKPHFDDDRLFFNLTHSHDLWICAISTEPVGIDLELPRSCRMELVAKRFFHSDEYRYLLQDDFRSFFTIWCAKESYVKYLGTGIDDEFKNFHVTDQHTLAKQLNGCFLHHFQVDDYCGCLCTPLPFYQLLDRRTTYENRD
ncbi:MAG: 4'-phosphopantetheinyl transferase superfamily protein [Erysipelotrichaceae bacterium]|nr:4'-phosphopantetheinyl transferase superfamily protein [Erysipelotrichaceae bacterium]